MPVHLHEGDGWGLLVELDLPLLLRPRKGQVEESIARKLDKILAGG